MKLRVGPKLLSIREERKMSQTEFAELLGMSQSHYSRLEKGDTQINFDQLLRFSETLNIPLHEFLPDSFTFHNHNHNGQGGVVFGNITVNNGVDEVTKSQQAEIERLNVKLKHAEEKIALLQEQVALLRGH